MARNRTIQKAINQKVAEKWENLHAFLKEQVIHDFDNISHYTSLEHAYYAESKFSLSFLGEI
jgi:hypothetical protein